MDVLTLATAAIPLVSRLLEYIHRPPLLERRAVLTAWKAALPHLPDLYLESSIRPCGHQSLSHDDPDDV